MEPRAGLDNAWHFLFTPPQPREFGAKWEIKARYSIFLVFVKSKSTGGGGKGKGRKRHNRKVSSSGFQINPKEASVPSHSLSFV